MLGDYYGGTGDNARAGKGSGAVPGGIRDGHGSAILEHVVLTKFHIIR